MLDHVDKIVNIGETAGKEYSIEVMLDNMQGIWENVRF